MGDTDFQGAFALPSVAKGVTNRGHSFRRPEPIKTANRPVSPTLSAPCRTSRRLPISAKRVAVSYEQARGCQGKSDELQSMNSRSDSWHVSQFWLKRFTKTWSCNILDCGSRRRGTR